jgi:NitT/TauT family transport system substrate-binding protein
VKADSPFKSLKDLKPESTIAFSTSGSSSNAIALAYVSELGAKGKPTATGSPPATLTQTMSGQIDVGWSSPPFALKELKEGKIRILARGSDVPSMKDQTVRTVIVNAEALKTKHDAILRFVAAYREAIDWMYSDPKAISLYAAKIKIDEDIAKDAVTNFFPKVSVQTQKISDLDGIMRDAVKLKFIDTPLTAQQTKELIQIPPAK